jgi:hypothetical protein
LRDIPAIAGHAKRTARKRRLALGLFTPSNWGIVTLLMLTALRTTAAFVLKATSSTSKQMATKGQRRALDHFSRKAHPLQSCPSSPIQGNGGPSPITAVCKDAPIGSVCRNATKRGQYTKDKKGAQSCRHNNYFETWPHHHLSPFPANQRSSAATTANGATRPHNTCVSNQLTMRKTPMEKQRSIPM